MPSPPLRALRGDYVCQGTWRCQKPIVHAPCPVPAPAACLLPMPSARSQCRLPMARLGLVEDHPRVSNEGGLLGPGYSCCSCANPPPFNQSRPASQRSGWKPQPLEQGGQRAGREAPYSIICLAQAPPDFVSQDASPMRCSVYEKEMPHSIKGEKCCNSEHLFHFEVHPTSPAKSEKPLK